MENQNQIKILLDGMRELQNCLADIQARYSNTFTTEEDMRIDSVMGYTIELADLTVLSSGFKNITVEPAVDGGMAVYGELGYDKHLIATFENSPDIDEDEETSRYQFVRSMLEREIEIFKSSHKNEE